MEIEGLDVLENLFRYACKQNDDAAKYCMQVWKVCHFWDDLIDHDPVDSYETNRAMSAAMVEINQNPFFRKHIAELNCMVSLIASNWHAANRYEREKKQLAKAYMLRAQLYNLPVLCAFLIGGQPWADQVAKISWDTYTEDINSFIKEIENA